MRIIKKTQAKNEEWRKCQDLLNTTFKSNGEMAKAEATMNNLQSTFDKIAKRIKENPNSDGWIRLCEILSDAAHDKRITSSKGASDFLGLMLDLAEDALTTSDAGEAVDPLLKVLKSMDQSRIAKRPRGKLTDNGDTLNDIIERLAKREDETSVELWPQLFSELDLLNLNPKDIKNKSDRKKDFYTYGAEKHISFGQFANRISEIRKKSG